MLSAGICVDKYEGSLWDIPPAQTVVIQKVKDGKVTLSDLTGAGAPQVGCSSAPFSLAAIPGTFPYDGNYAAPIYAASVPGALPSNCVSAFQAKAACELSTRRIMSNLEWISAATMKEVAVSAARRRHSALLAEVERPEQVTITRRGVAVAQLPEPGPTRPS